MKRQNADGVEDYDDAVSPVPAASGFGLAAQLDMFTDHVDISQAFVQGELLPGDGHNDKVYILPHLSVRKILSTCIAF